MGLISLYLGAAIPALWGISHLFPTRSVVKGFGDISRDNKLIITMEWITEGVALIFIGLLVVAVTVFDESIVSCGIPRCLRSLGVRPYNSRDNLAVHRFPGKFPSL